jgi:hypothetical protein
MTSTSAGSQPDAKKFLEGKVDELYALEQEERMKQLAGFRTAEVGDYAMRGVESNDIPSKYQGGSLRV